MLVGGVLWRMDWQRQVPEARLMQAVHRGPEHTQSLIQHALEEDAAADEQVAAALLEEAQYDPRPLHIIYQPASMERECGSEQRQTVALSQSLTVAL
ncbi:hypothetical protein HaLaN_27872 [Haematococcus lacustris]|uniref:Uncharacterized protein n=1 Tax=Haematococcus lacustris TaxID=44745 RepID=A0A6A0A935_HAELA|nr:hypothetical protein HaLaN_27872 [Haematococcus lacustris]